MLDRLRSLTNPLKQCYRAWRRRRERAVVRSFHRLYYDGPLGQRRLFDQTSWFGVPILKCPLDLFIYQEILYRTRPEVIVETGISRGGSTLYLANICDLLGVGKVLACDITLEDVRQETRDHPRIELFEGSSTSPEMLTEIGKRCEGLRTMVILDSDHRAAHVREELKLYAPLVSSGCYLICEDTNMNGHPVYESFGEGPYEAVEEFLANNRGWTVDKDCEKLLMTFNPCGYLLRE